MLKLIYIGLIIIISLWTIYLYINLDQDYKNEIIRINNIENKQRKRREFINHHRLNSIPCIYSDLNNPRNCFIKSNFKCKWSELADRCNQIQ